MYEHVDLIDEQKEVNIKYTAIEGASKPRKWIPLVILCLGVLCLIVAVLLTGLHFNRSSPGCDTACRNATAETLLEARNVEVTEERDRLKILLQKTGWVQFQGSFYLGSSSKLNWNRSRQFCQQKGADLIIINSKEEQEFVRSTFQENRWIGLSDGGQEGVWKWVDGSSLNISFWYPGEPNDHRGAEDCVEVEFEKGLRNWNDAPCTQSFKCICEFSYARF